MGHIQRGYDGGHVQGVSTLPHCGLRASAQTHTRKEPTHAYAMETWRIECALFASSSNARVPMCKGVGGQRTLLAFFGGGW